MNWERLWATLGQSLATLSVLGVVLATVGSPLLDRLLLWLMERNNKAIKGLIEEWFKERIKKIDGAVDKVESNEERIEMLFESSKAQGEAIEKEVTRHNEAQTKALATMTATLERIQVQAEETARSVSHIYGLMKEEPWDRQTERRHKPRREGDT